MFCALFQNYLHLFEKMISVYESYSKLSKELKSSIKIKVGQSVLELIVIDQSNILTVLIYNLKTTWPTKLSTSMLSSLGNLL